MDMSETSFGTLVMIKNIILKQVNVNIMPDMSSLERNEGLRPPQQESTNQWVWAGYLRIFGHYRLLFIEKGSERGVLHGGKAPARHWIFF